MRTTSFSISVLLLLSSAATTTIALTNGFAGVRMVVTPPETTTKIISARTSSHHPASRHARDVLDDTSTSTRTIHAMARQHQDKETKKKSLQSRIGSTVVATALMLGSAFTPNNNILPASFHLGVPPAHAEGSKVVGALKGSGLVFKDTLQIERFEDPKIKGVVLYISNFDRPITEKLGGNFFNDPAYASVACAKTTKDIAIADNIQKGPQGEEVFEESRSLLFKTLRVQRIFDAESNTVVYVSYNTRLDKSDDTNKSRFKSSLCAVNLNDQ